MSGLLQVVDAWMTTASSRGSTTSSSVESGTAERISRVHASSTASRRSATESKSRVLERGHGGHQRAQHGEVLERGGDAEFDRPSAAQLPVVRVSDVGHMTSRQCRSEITPGRIPANHVAVRPLVNDDVWQHAGRVIPGHEADGVAQPTRRRGVGRHPTAAPDHRHGRAGAGWADPRTWWRYTPGRSSSWRPMMQ